MDNTASETAIRCNFDGFSDWYWPAVGRAGDPATLAYAHFDRSAPLLGGTNEEALL